MDNFNAMINTTIFTTLALIIFKLFMVRDLAAENLALRQQLAALNHKTKRPRIRLRDQVFWVLLSRLWPRWKDVLVIVKPDTVVKWHRQGFKLFWRFKSRRRGPGRPPIDPVIKKLILEMAKANPTWGAPRIHGELKKLGIEVSERTVSNILPKERPKPPSQTWRTFLKNHIGKCSMDFFTVPTAGFRILYVLVILSNDRRKIVHFNVTESPTAEWTAQQVIDAFPWDTAPKYLMRDRDSIYGDYFKSRLEGMDIEEVISAYRSPWQNPFVERVIGSIRRDCLDHMIILNEGHLRRILRSYFEYYHEDRTHLGLGKDTPNKRPIQQKPVPRGGAMYESAKVIKFPRVGGLHHRYEWKEAA